MDPARRGRKRQLEDLRRIGRQIEVTKKRGEEESAKVAAQPADARGRKRRFVTDTSLPMPAHNDGLAVGGDDAPDRLFLFSARRRPPAASRTIPAERLQVRHHPYLAPIRGPDGRGDGRARHRAAVPAGGGRHGVRRQLPALPRAPRPH